VPPLRDVLRHQRNAQVVLAEVGGLDLERRTTCRLLDRTVTPMMLGLLVTGIASGLEEAGGRHAKPGTKDHSLSAAYLQALFRTGATGLEPATSGVTGRANRDDCRQ
jgi:hypothetical protein